MGPNAQTPICKFVGFGSNSLFPVGVLFILFVCSVIFLCVFTAVVSRFFIFVTRLISFFSDEFLNYWFYLPMLILFFLENRWSFFSRCCIHDCLFWSKFIWVFLWSLLIKWSLIWSTCFFSSQIFCWKDRLDKRKKNYFCFLY